MVYEWLRNIKFIWPENFILLGVVAFLIWQYVNSSRTRHGAFLISAVPKYLPATFKVRLRHLPFVLRIGTVTCLVLALARPQHQTNLTRTEGEGIDIVLCMDVSGSMGTSDIKPNRFQVAKDVAINFVKNRPVDRIGLVIFSGESFTKCPLTPDKNTVLSQLENLRIMDGGYLERGTLIGEGLATSVNRIIKGKSKSRVIILLTDGKEDAPPSRVIDPAAAIELAKANRVRVYSIGMGSDETTDEQFVEGFGTVVRNYIDEGLLRQIATETGGRYFRAMDKETLQSIYNQIDKLEKSKVQTIQYQQIKEMYGLLVLLALGLLLLEVFLRYTWLRKNP
ncbi:MAG: VWA domain-containing protein [Niabella sp.]